MARQNSVFSYLIALADSGLDAHSAIFERGKSRASGGSSQLGLVRPDCPFPVYSAQTGVETMVSDHGLRRGQTMGKGSIRVSEC